MFLAILVLLHPTSGYPEIHFYFDMHSEITEIHVCGIINQLEVRNKKLEKHNLINEHVLNCEPDPLTIKTTR